MSKTILTGHTSPETAYLVENYPYGFRLRCKIRYWLDCDPKRGGRGAPGKTPFVAAVETTPAAKPVRLKLRRVISFCNRAHSGFANRSLDPACEVVSDGLACFGAVADAGCAHQVVKTGSGAAAARTPRLQMGQHGARQYQGRYRGDLPSDRLEACAALPR